MKTIAVTAGIDYWYPSAARRLTERWNRLARHVDDGFECLDVSSLVPWGKFKNRMFAKAYLWDIVPSSVERIMWVDCDCFPCRSVGGHELPEAPFAAVSDTRWSEETTRKDWPEGAEIARIFNAGVVVCRRETRDVFEEVKKIGEDGTRVREDGDQRWFNLYVARRYKDFDTNPAGWHEMGAEWNVINDKVQPIRPVIMHFAGVWNRWNYLEMLHNAADEAERFAMRARGELGPTFIPGV